MGKPQLGPTELLLRLPDQDNIRFPVSANHRELLAVEREVEVADDLRFEIRELLAGRSVKIL